MGVPRQKTLEQIGIALRECGTFARDYGVEIMRLYVGIPNDPEPERFLKYYKALYDTFVAL